MIAKFAFIRCPQAGAAPLSAIRNATRTNMTTHSVFLQSHHAHDETVRDELAAGLLAPQAHASPKYLYDMLGSRLFDAICALPEYYLTRTEAQILADHGQDIAAVAGHGGTLIDLGAGNCEKAASLFPLLRPVQYVPVDISVEFLRNAVTALQLRHPEIDMIALGQDFSERLELPAGVRGERRLFFYPGSSIGNYTPEQALTLLRRLHAAAGTDGALLIGVDLVKEKKLLDAAYDDALGVTAAFNLNLLRHLNRLLDADFDLGDWRHCAFYDPQHSRVEMHLEARRDVTVSWRGGRRRFAEGERIHTENSYKYTPDAFIALLAQAGFADARSWTDADGWFMVCHAHAG
jgi:dimethylhistidine N-methyltransferase